MSTKVRQNKEDMIFDTAIGSALVLILLIALYPLIYVLSASISDPIAVIQGKVWLLPKGITLEPYRLVFQNKDIITGYKNTFMYTVAGTVLNVVLTIAAAYPLSRKDFFGRNFLTMLFTFTMFFSGGLIPSYLLIKGLGLYNNFWVMILPGAVGIWNIIVTRTFFQNTIPMELQEAAFMDGYSNLGTLWNVVLPLSKPIIAVMVMFYGVGHWNAFFNALIYISDRSKYPLQLVLREILILTNTQNMVNDSSEELLRQQMMGEAIKYSVIVVASLPVIMLYPFLQKYFIKGVMVGAIKG